MNKYPFTMKLIPMLLGLLLCPSTDAEQITKRKNELADFLKKDSAGKDQPFVGIVKNFVEHLVAVTPPAREDVESARVIGAFEVPEPKESLEKPPAPKPAAESDPQAQGEGGANAPPAPSLIITP